MNPSLGLWVQYSNVSDIKPPACKWCPHVAKQGPANISIRRRQGLNTQTTSFGCVNWMFDQALFRVQANKL